MISLTYLCLFLAFLGIANAGQLRLMQYNIFDILNDPQSAQASQQVFQWLNWQHNDQTIRTINNMPGGTFRVGHNRFSYMSYEEIEQTFLTLRVTLPDVKVSAPQSQTQLNFAPTQYLYLNSAPYVPPQTNVTNIDWRTKGAVSVVKDQGNCGACWAFSATAQIQSQLLMLYNTNVTLSQQQLLDCSWAYGNIGCSGGMMNNAFQYIIANGITLSSLYPYTQSTSTCRYNRATMQSFSISTSKVFYNDCSALQTLLKSKPTTVVISADMSFIFYSSGVLNTCGTSINHAVQLIGFYKDSQQSYYIGKNSWGTSWGQNGFINIDATVQNGNLCNVCTYPQYIE